MRVSSRQRHRQAMMAPRSEAEVAVTSLVRGIAGYLTMLDRNDAIAAEDAQRLKACLGAITGRIADLLHGPLDRLNPDLLVEELAELEQRCSAALAPAAVSTGDVLEDVVVLHKIGEGGRDRPAHQHRATEPDLHRQHG